MTTTHALSTHATSVERGLIHDLRNLFGVVASAKHMLEDGTAGERRDTLLAAIEDAAQRGGQLTSNLLAPATANDAPIVFDVSNRVLMMVPMIRAMAGHAAEVRFDLAKARALVKLAPALFEAVIIELVTNARAAFHLPGHILVRVRPQDRSVRITIADDASGMEPEKARRALADDRPVAVKGTGLGRVRQFVQSCRGSMRLRSRLGRGTVVTLTLPMIPSGTAGETAPAPDGLYPFVKKGHIS